MKNRKRKGASLPMVIIAIVLVTAFIGIMAFVLQTGNAQTKRVYDYLNAKYVATSGAQLAMGAYFEGDGTSSPLYTEFKNRAERRSNSTEKITSNHAFSYGIAEIEMTGAFENNSRAKADYYVTIKSRAKLADGSGYYVHTVVFNFESSGIRSENGGIE